MITSTKKEHAIKTQLYRWYNGYERYFTASRIANQLELLVEDAVITTPSRSIAGKANYAPILNEYKKMKISHSIEKMDIHFKEGGAIEVEVGIVYHGIQSDGTDNCLGFTYENALQEIPNELPVFTAVNLKVGGFFKSPEFQDSYPRLRSLALMHYYLFLIEKLADNVAEFQEILTDDFQLNLSQEVVLNSMNDLDNWLKSVSTKLVVTSHYPKNIEVKNINRDTYELKVDFDWEGWTKSNQKMIAETRHTWVITDKKNDRFAKIQSIEVEQLTPFAIVD